MTAVRILLLAAALGSGLAAAASADQTAPEQPAAPNAADPTAAQAVAAPAGAPDELEIDPVEPDFTLINLPTTARLPNHRWAFRVTHRFARPLGAGDFSDLAADFFGFDGGALIGLEVRFGLTRRAQIGANRLSDRTITLFAQHELLRQGTAPIGLAAVGSLEGRDNLQEDHSPRLGLVLSRRLGDRVALYAAPAWVGNTNLQEETAGADDSTLVLGLGGRLRLTEAYSLLAEITPRLAGFGDLPGGGTAGAHATFGVEHRVGGHMFQINFSDDLGTTPAQVARGRQAQDWFIGFNISRKFY